MSKIGQEQFGSVEEFVRAHEGNQVIKRVLIANNGIAAVKAMRSIKKWSYDTFGNDRAIEFVAMATPEDIKANAAYIHLADECIDVPGGANHNNYANVTLIKDIAERTKSDAVWAGWGHASENPKLPDALARSGIVWIGPPPSAMRALGDKIGSTLIAQSAGVSCMPWNGSEIKVDFKNDNIPDDVYHKACIHSGQEALDAAERVGYPVMIKASEGGGGKGIRKVLNSNQMEAAYQQVKGEVPGSPIFIMGLATNCRHLEVQLLGDHHGQAIAIAGRDCSIQRRHQKIIEEGPVLAASPETWRAMEQAAIRLALEVGYANAGTVEYLFTHTGEYYFLELNPRLQVEHPVTELISGVNLPAAQLQVAMGLPLHRIRDVRTFYGEDPAAASQIDFNSRPGITLPGHVIACRITAENPDKEFQPTSGTIEELNFRSTPNVWGYFSVAAHSNIHEFSDSQFGHVFSFGATRDVARRNMVMALKELSIRGEIRTIIEYLQEICQDSDFKDNKVTTSWLEAVMMANRNKEVKALPPQLAVVMGAAYRGFQSLTVNEGLYMDSLTRGITPSPQMYEDLVRESSELIYEGVKYPFTVYRTSPEQFLLNINDSQVFFGLHQLADGGLLVKFNRRKYIVYGQEFAAGLRLTVDGSTVIFGKEYDPTQLTSAMQGKLVRWRCKDGDHLEKDDPYCEVEVMKMYITLTAPEAGEITLLLPRESILEPGSLMATLALDHPERVQKAKLFTESLDSSLVQGGASLDTQGKPHVTLKESRERLQCIMNGYYSDDRHTVAALNAFMKSLRNPQLPLEQFADLVSTLTGRVPETLSVAFYECAERYANAVVENRFYWESPARFPAPDIQVAVQSAIDSLKADEREAVQSHLDRSGLNDFLSAYEDGNHNFAITQIVALVMRFYEYESQYSEADGDGTGENVLTQLRRAEVDYATLSTIMRGHSRLAARLTLVQRLLTIVSEQLRPMVGQFTAVLSKVASLKGPAYAGVVLQARLLLMRHGLPPKKEREVEVKTIVKSASTAQHAEERVSRLLPLIHNSGPIEEIIMPMFDNRSQAVRLAAAELYIRRIYEAIEISAFQATDINGHIQCTWQFNKMAHEAKHGMPRNDSSSDLALLEKKGNRQCVFGYFQKYSDVSSTGLEALLRHYNGASRNDDPVHILYVAFGNGGKDLPSEETVASHLSSLARPLGQLLIKAGVRRVTFSFLNKGRIRHFTFHHALNYGEEVSARDLLPSLVACLQLSRMSHFDLKLETSFKDASVGLDNLHLFAAYPKKPIAKGGARLAWDGRRYFIRAAVLNVDDDEEDGQVQIGVPSAFTNALNALEIAIGDQRSIWQHNSLFLSVLSQSSRTIPEMVDMVRSLARNHSDKIRALNLTTVEVRIILSDRTGRKMYRFIGNNPTGYILNVEIYQEVPAGDGKVCLRQIEYEAPGTRKPTCYDICDANWDGKDVLAPYPTLSPFLVKRMSCKQLDTLYCYDFIPVLHRAMDRIWSKFASEAKVELPTKPTVDAVELVLDASGTKLEEVQRPAGENDIGMVAWKVTIRSPGAPEGRDIVLIANDISFQSGTFGVLEDKLFDLASRYSRARGLPRVHLAANSGARIGLAEDVVQRIKIAWVGDDPLKGFEYIYLEEDSYEELKDVVLADKTEVDGEVRYVLTSIIGGLDGIGVENLSGSGLIAGETSQAFQDVFTLTYVSCRTVGIGAYLARLGQRVIQKKTQSIILTGYGALNKLLGKKVYSTNGQLGGPEVMFTNGISHLTVNNDLEGMTSMLEWLSYVPNVRHGSVSRGVTSLVDPVDRDVVYTPGKAAYDPRHLVTGAYDDNGVWQPGFFDRGSWLELQSGWAKSVVVGRAALGGSPMGVICVETRTTTTIIPADPANPESVEVSTQRAGQVWYPDSAYKTMQAVEDMLAEDLPIMIFANWRGFSGGMKDMLDEVLKFGSYIVDSLRKVRQPVFVYIPPCGTLRGGAWVVVDSQINPDFIEMYADPTARGGVLEPEGFIGVKFRQPKMLKMMRKMDSTVMDLQNQLANESKRLKQQQQQQQMDKLIKTKVKNEQNTEAEEKTSALQEAVASREKQLLPLYHQAAQAIVDLHDTPGRMLAKGCIREIVAWADSRRYFYHRLQVRLAENSALNRLLAADETLTRASATAALQQMLQDLKAPASASDSDLSAWYTANASRLDERIAAVKSSAVGRQLSEALANPGALLANLSADQKQALLAALNGGSGSSPTSTSGGGGTTPTSTSQQAKVSSPSGGGHGKRNRGRRSRK